MLSAIGASDGIQKDILFTNIDAITETIPDAKPDYYCGAQPEQIRQDMRNELRNCIIPSSHDHLPAAPNFFLEAKGPARSFPVVQRQACHDGAIGARAMQSILSCRQNEAVYDNNIYTISSTYYAGQLKLYGHSTAQPNGPGTRPEYYMHQLGAYAMTYSRDTFRDGATALKNARDSTEEHRNTVIAHANEMSTLPTDGGGVKSDEALSLHASD